MGIGYTLVLSTQEKTRIWNLFTEVGQMHPNWWKRQDITLVSRSYPAYNPLITRFYIGAGGRRFTTGLYPVYWGSIVKI